MAAACARPIPEKPPGFPLESFTVRLEQLPATTPEGASVFLAGTFNEWNPGDARFRLTPDGRGNHVTVLPSSVSGAVEFKFTLGSWESVETDGAGRDVSNRATVIGSGLRSYTGRVAAWRDPAKPRVKNQTRRPTVSILSDSFYMPQLARWRRVWIYLPPGYESGTERYPVLYIQDGQNVFDDATAFAGEWGVDESLDSLSALGDRGVIVIAIDHGGDRRLDELSPWRNPKFGGGEGDKYVDFLVETLKPYVDFHYRTMPDRVNTGIAGSSMGGLISLYAVMRHPDVFGRAGIFSPALWFHRGIYDFVTRAGTLPADTKLYFVSGSFESASPETAGGYVRDQDRMAGALEDAGLRKGTNLVVEVRADGRHSEWFWRREFPAAYRWLFRGEVP